MLGCNRASAAAALIEQVSRVVSVIAIASHKRYNRSIHPRLRNHDASTAPLWPGADLQPATRVPLVQKRWPKATIRPAVSRNCGARAAGESGRMHIGPRVADRAVSAPCWPKRKIRPPDGRRCAIFRIF